ncbi:unnamed protein product, partial [Brugia timori]|uniref:PhoLip_ATPase_C domain-containing protein n=1 Tax=Brugia timori TaxID=42155 RepID=A0A0R3Q5Z2_9BILA
MYGALLVFDSDFIHIVSISFTALIVTELIMVALTIHTWHWAMLLAQALSLSLYAGSLLVLDNFFDRQFVTTWIFLSKTTAITAISCFPLYIIKALRRRFSPPSYAKAWTHCLAVKGVGLLVDNPIYMSLTQISVNEFGPHSLPGTWMAVLAGIGYLFIAFSPSVVIFRRVIASDPLRIILFVLGGLNHMSTAGQRIT